MNAIVAEKVHRLLGDRSPGEDTLIRSGWLEKDKEKLVAAWKVPKEEGHVTGMRKAYLVLSGHPFKRDEVRQEAYGEEVMSIPEQVGFVGTDVETGRVVSFLLASPENM